MPESVLVNKAENFLKEIANDAISLENIEDFDVFKDLYFKLDDRLDFLQNLKDDMDAQGYTTPFTSLNKYGAKSVADVDVEEMGENSRHNKIFRMNRLQHKAEVIIAKNRNGPIGNVILRFDGATSNFQDYAGQYDIQNQ